MSEVYIGSRYPPALWDSPRYTRAMNARSWPVVVLLAGLAAACGGRSESDAKGDAGNASGGSGNASSGGSGGAGNASSGGSGNVSGAGGAPACVPGGACAPAGATCTPTDECCPCSYLCQDGTWHTSACPACEAPQCPPTAPAQGDACDPCEALLPSPCAYANGCVSATCNGKTWSVTVTPCPSKIPCDAGNPSCPDEMLCVTPGGLGDTPYCAPNPCGPEPVSCGCAGSLCTYGSCASANAQAVNCICPEC